MPSSYILNIIMTKFCLAKHLFLKNQNYVFNLIITDGFILFNERCWIQGVAREGISPRALWCLPPRRCEFLIVKKGNVTPRVTEIPPGQMYLNSALLMNKTDILKEYKRKRNLIEKHKRTHILMLIIQHIP